MKYSIDINCDLGEGTGNESELIEYISSCSIACGGHAGTAESMEECIRLAKIYQKRIGAHPSYPDPVNFGRKTMKLPAAELKAALSEQLDQFFSIAADLDAPVFHVKPHGALYNDMYHDDELCLTFIEVLESFQKDLHIFCQPGSKLGKIAPLYGYPVYYEGFGDRRYTAAGSLTSRSEPYALIKNTADLFEQVLLMIQKKQVQSHDGVIIPMDVQTICLHGDSPYALQFAEGLHHFLIENAIRIE